MGIGPTIRDMLLEAGVKGSISEYEALFSKAGLSALDLSDKSSPLTAVELERIGVGFYDADELQLVTKNDELTN